MLHTDGTTTCHRNNTQNQTQNAHFGCSRVSLAHLHTKAKRTRDIRRDGLVVAYVASISTFRACPSRKAVCATTLPTVPNAKCRTDPPKPSAVAMSSFIFS